jgi:hypothetical protein
LYRSRYGTIALHADVKQGQPVDYFVLANGKRLAEAPPTLPAPAASCAAEKKLPKPTGAGASPCSGQRFRVVLARGGDELLALLYGFDGSTAFIFTMMQAYWPMLSSPSGTTSRQAMPRARRKN